MFRRPRPRLKILGNRHIDLDGRTVSFTLKRSPRAKYVRFEIKRDTGLTVVITKSYDKKLLPDLLHKRRRWILKNLGALESAPPSAPRYGIRDGDIVSYLGRQLRVVIERKRVGVNTVRFESERLIASLRSDGESAGKVLEGWYRTRAMEFIGRKAELVSARLGTTYNRLTIRGQRTRWGSCSHKGNLSFNWKLMMVPEDVIDYVVIHEMAHLKEMNHTKRFWKLVERHCPRWREHRKWLRENQAELTVRFFS